MANRVIVTLQFDVNAHGNKQWFNVFNEHAVDLLKHANEMPGLGLLVNATSTRASGVGDVRRLNVNVRGVPTAGAPKIFTFCADCPNTSWCRTQGHCERAALMRLRDANHARAYGNQDPPRKKKVVKKKRVK